MFRASIAAMAIGLGLLTAGAAAAAPDQVTIRDGALKGVVSGDVVAFKGIPFAASPVGDLRWRAPQPEASWTGVRDATAFGPACLQGGQFNMAMGASSEDCLTVNVWAPAHPATKKLPVMVWIYGGGFVGGSSGAPFYDGSNFARDGVILVSLNYRLGRLGWFAHPALTKEGKGPLGNYGLMDQIAALKWVQANIGAFGGDPKNVTVFGESAGAISVNFLMISPQAKGLFAKAISESGFGRFDAPTIAVAERNGAAYARTQGVEGDDAAALAALRALPAKTLVANPGGLADADVPKPMIDGAVIVERTDDGFARGRQARIPYMVGGNSFEASLFARTTAANPEVLVAKAGGDRAATLALFDPSSDPVKAAYNISTESMISEPNRYLAREEAKAHVPAYLYYFSYVAPAQRAASPGAGHGSEISYVFGNLPHAPITYGTRLIPAATEDGLALSKAMHAYWVAFARTGNPGAAGGVRWPAYSAASDPLIEFGNDGVNVREGLLKPRLDLIEARVEAGAATR
jgi:para-nitrobenzyl esterase